MDKYVAIGYNLSRTNRDLIVRMVANVLDSSVIIVDLMSYNLQSMNYLEDPNVIFLIYGRKSLNLFSKIDWVVSASTVGKRKLKTKFLPDPEFLDPETGDEKARVEAWHVLLEIKGKPVEKVNTINGDSLPDLTTNNIQELEKTLKAIGSDEWIGVTTNGKSIKISCVPKEGPEDIKMTFAELYAIKLAMEVLQLKEIQIVSKPKNVNQ